jgi:hypothetical protein
MRRCHVWSVRRSTSLCRLVGPSRTYASRPKLGGLVRRARAACEDLSFASEERRVSRRASDEYQRRFRQLDKDGDGVVTKQEAWQHGLETASAISKSDGAVGKIYMQAAFGLATLSLAVDDVLALRSLFSAAAVAGAVHAVWGYRQPQWGRLVWMAMLLLLNGWHISKIVEERYQGVGFTGEEAEIFRYTFADLNMTRREGLKLLRSGAPACLPAPAPSVTMLGGRRRRHRRAT